jgi:hypothetical protein
MERTFQITLIYKVSVHEENLLKYHTPRDQEDIERAKRLLDATLKDQNATNYLMLQEAAFDLAGHEGLPELFTDDKIDDHTAAEKVLEKLSPEDRDYFEGGVVDTLGEVFKAELDHLRIGMVREDIHQQHTSQDSSQLQAETKKATTSQTQALTKERAKGLLEVACGVLLVNDLLSRIEVERSRSVWGAFLLATMLAG